MKCTRYKHLPLTNRLQKTRCNAALVICWYRHLQLISQIIVGGFVAYQIHPFLPYKPNNTDTCREIKEITN